MRPRELLSSKVVVANNRAGNQPELQTAMGSGHRKPHGKTVRLPAGYTAFVPAPLPPAFEWNRELVNALSAADRAIGRLAGESRRLPNPHLLIRPFIRREAVLSSRIEGTQSTLTDRARRGSRRPGRA